MNPLCTRPVACLVHSWQPRFLYAPTYPLPLFYSILKQNPRYHFVLSCFSKYLSKVKMYMKGNITHNTIATPKVSSKGVGVFPKPHQ